MIEQEFDNYCWFCGNQWVAASENISPFAQRQQVCICGI